MHVTVAAVSLGLGLIIVNQSKTHDINPFIFGVPVILIMFYRFLKPQRTLIFGLLGLIFSVLKYILQLYLTQNPYSQHVIAAVQITSALKILFLGLTFIEVVRHWHLYKRKTSNINS
jgi:hypothetical protein